MLRKSYLLQDVSYILFMQWQENRCWQNAKLQIYKTSSRELQHVQWRLKKDILPFNVLIQSGSQIKKIEKRNWDLQI